MNERTETGNDLAPPAGAMNRRVLLRRVIYPLVVVAAIVGVIWWIESRGDDDVSPSGFEYGVRDIEARFVPAGLEVGSEVGQLAPDFELELLDGDVAWLTDFRGQPVVLNFWATWCQPCRQEMPQLVDEYSKHKDEGLVIIGLNMQEGRDLIQPFAEERGIDYPILIDRDGDVGDEYRLLGLPTTYFIDANGVIVSVFRGPLEEKVEDTNVQGAIGQTELQQRIAEIMAIDAQPEETGSGSR
jgi:peroxiredoxin